MPPDDLRSERFTNRELSWLDFNNRVLAQAEDPTVPLLERLSYCSIYASNLDEFFMVRVAGLADQVAAGVTQTPPDGLTPLEQLNKIRSTVATQLLRLERVHVDRLQVALGEAGIRLSSWKELDQTDQDWATKEFEQRIFPVLTPLAVDPGHPFPYISTLSLNLAVIINDGDLGQRHFARVKVPPALNRFMVVPSGVYIPVEQIIAAHLDDLFPGMKIVGSWPFRVTRNADITLDDEDADDLLEAVEVELRRRRFGRAIRLEIDHTMPNETREMLVRELDLDESDVYPYRGLLDCTGYQQFAGLNRPDLKFTSFKGVTPGPLCDIEGSTDFFERIRRNNVLVHHPYESFSASVSEFVHQASIDPKVLAIKLTLYRTSGDSPIVQSLIRAAERGKQVAVLVELKARFDERANIEWARRLEEAGVHVAYGLVGLKIHTKTTLVVRDEPDGLRRYCHVGTGNYNPKTARVYEDIGILTASAQVGDDLTQLFNFLTGYSRDVEFSRLIVAPHDLRQSLTDLISREMQAPDGTGRIIFKMNSLVDAAMIDHLYTASQAGVQIDLIVRGICCLRPGVPGLSENIRVRSLVGRYLEHSRIYYFGLGGPADQPGEYYIGSADLMPRNLDRRLEALLEIRHRESRDRLEEILAINLADDSLSWELDAGGTYRRITGGTLNAHEVFEAKAAERATRHDPLNPELWARGEWPRVHRPRTASTES